MPNELTADERYTFRDMERIIETGLHSFIAG